MKIAKNKGAERILLNLYLSLYLLIIISFTLKAVYMKYGYLGALLLQYNIILLWLLPIVVGISLRFFPLDMQRIVCKKNSFIKITDKFFDIVKRINIVLFLIYIIYNIIANSFKYNYMPLMTSVDGVLIYVAVFAGIYMQQLFYHYSAKGREYSWCKRWRK